MIAYIALPALISLSIKLALLVYAIRRPRNNDVTRLFAALLGAFVVHNLCEFVALNYYVQHGLTSTAESLGLAYMVLVVPVFALILHVSLRLSFDLPRDDLRVRLQSLLYVPVVALVTLLVFTDQLVQGFQPFQNTVLRVPGPHYLLFECFAVGCMAVALACLTYGSRTGRASFNARTRSRWWLLALAPSALLVIYLIVANHFKIAKLSSTIYLPLTWIFFLVIATWATTGSWRSLPLQQHRLFDMMFFVPWSRVRRCKQAFYTLVRATAAQVKHHASLDDALVSVSALLHCPVALVGRNQPLLIHAGEGSLKLAQFPHDVLPDSDSVIVADEIAQSMPHTHRMMKQFAIGAIVPFYPQSQSTAAWLLLGASFSDTIRTPLDFKVIERLFDSLKALFLDQLGVIRAEIHQYEDHERTAHARMHEARTKLELLSEENNLLREANFRLMRENLAVRESFESPPIANPTKPGPVLKLVDNEDDECTEADWNMVVREHAQNAEAHLIAKAIKHCKGNKSEAARLLGVPTHALERRIRDLEATAASPTSPEMTGPRVSDK